MGISKIYIGLGTNLGDLVENLDSARKMIGNSIGKIDSVSPIYKTEPLGIKSQPDFLNQVIGLDTEMNSEKVMNKLIEIEEKMGRVRVEKWGPRIIDLDILFWGEEVVESERLKIPHPLLHERLFVLKPMADLIPGFTHPVLKRKIVDLLKDCSDKSTVSLFKL